MNNKILLALLFLCNGLASNTQKEVFLFDVLEQGEVFQILEKNLPSSFTIGTFSCNADLPIQIDEICYLTGFKNNAMVTISDIASGIRYLFKKEQYKKISCTVTFTDSEVKKDIHLDIIGLWTVGSIKFRGVLIGKDTYRQYYMMEPGDIFDINKHEDSLSRIVLVLNDNGYRNSRVVGNLDHCDGRKNVNILIDIHKKSRFMIGNVALKILGTDLSTKKENSLNDEISKLFFSQFIRTYYSQEMVNQVISNIKNFLLKKGFPCASINYEEYVNSENKEIDLNVSIKLPKKRNTLFVGNIFFSDEQLLNVITQFRASTWIVPLSLIKDEIISIYRAQGFLNASIDVQEKEDICKFFITEGDRACVGSIKLVGADSIDHSRCIKKFFASIIRERYYNKLLIDNALDNLLSYYADRAFLQASIVDFFVTDQDASGSQILVVTIDEGKATYIKTVLIDTNVEIPAMIFFKCSGEFIKGVDNGVVYKLQSPELCTIEFLHCFEQWLLYWFKRKGIKDIKINPEIIRYGTGNCLRWNVRIEDFARETFGRTVIVGNLSIPFRNIIRELRYREGDKWNRVRIQESLDRLKRISIFEDVHLYPDNEMFEDGHRPLILRIQEDDPFELRIRIGIGIINTGPTYKFRGLTYKSGVTCIYKNITGSADQVCFEADITRTYRVLEIQYKRPWFIGVPIELLLKLFNNNFQYPGLIHGKANLYSLLQEGGLVGVQYTWTGGTGECNAGVEWMKTTINISNDFLFNERVSRAIDFSPELVGVKIPYAYVESTLLLNYLNNKISATKGLLTLLSLKAMIPIKKLQGASYFVKILGEQSIFIPYRSMVCAIRARCGYIFHHNFKNIMPSERFYLGGASSIRSYEADMCPPVGKLRQDVQCSCSGACTEDILCERIEFVPQGGKAMVNTTIEFRFPIYGGFGITFFQDFGYLSNGSWKELTNNNLLAGTGAGMRYDTPVGPLRFDVGFKWRTDCSSPSRYAWSLTLGHPF